MTICIGPRTRPPARTSGEPTMAFRSGHVKARPSPALARHVEYYWVTRWERRDDSSTLAAALLDPCVHLQVQDGRAEMMGVMRAPYRIRIEGTGCVVGVRFRPGGFHPFVRQPVERFTDRIVPFAELFAHTADATADLWDAVSRCDGDADAHARVAAARFDTLLEALAPEPCPVVDEVAALVALAAADATVRRVGDLARASGRSERTLHRLFRRYVGVSPAWVIRRYRLHAAARRLTAAPTTDVQGLAYELGYADQAHFIRDFRATIGVTPGAFVSARS